jgi:hypothetical protein
MSHREAGGGRPRRVRPALVLLGALTTALAVWLSTGSAGAAPSADELRQAVMLGSYTYAGQTTAAAATDAPADFQFSGGDVVGNSFTLTVTAQPQSCPDAPCPTVLGPAPGGSWPSFVVTPDASGTYTGTQVWTLANGLSQVCTSFRIAGQQWPLEHATDVYTLRVVDARLENGEWIATRVVGSDVFTVDVVPDAVRDCGTAWVINESDVFTIQRAPAAAPLPLPSTPHQQLIPLVPAGDLQHRGSSGLAEHLLLTVLLVLLIVFPSQLFNSTLKAHYDEIMGSRLVRGLRTVLLPFRRPAPADGTERPGTASWWAFAIFTGASALLYGSLDPRFGLSWASFVLFVGLGLSLAAVSLAYSMPARLLARRRGERGRLRLYPATLAVAGLCVLVSRLVHFQPGYVYGLIGGFAVARQHTRAEEGRGVLASAVWTLVLAVLAWLAWSAVASAAAKPGAAFPVILLGTMLAAIFVAGVQSLVFALIPLRFLDGDKLFRWTRLAWAMVYAAGVFAYVHVMLDPRTKDHHRTTASLVKVIVLFASFGVVSVAFWGYFRFRKPKRPAGDPGRVEQAVPPPPAPVGPLEVTSS